MFITPIIARRSVRLDAAAPRPVAWRKSPDYYFKQTVIMEENDALTRDPKLPTIE